MKYFFVVRNVRWRIANIFGHFVLKFYNSKIIFCFQIKPHLHSSVVEFNDVVGDLERIKQLKAVALNLSL